MSDNVFSVVDVTEQYKSAAVEPEQCYDNLVTVILFEFDITYVSPVRTSQHCTHANCLQLFGYDKMSGEVIVDYQFQILFCFVHLNIFNHISFDVQ